MPVLPRDMFEQVYLEYIVRCVVVRIRIKVLSSVSTIGRKGGKFVLIVVNCLFLILLHYNSYVVCCQDMRLEPDKYVWDSISFILK